LTVSLGIRIAGAAVRGVFLRWTGLDDPLFAMQALKHVVSRITLVHVKDALTTLRAA